MREWGEWARARLEGSCENCGARVPKDSSGHVRVFFDMGCGTPTTGIGARGGGGRLPSGDVTTHTRPDSTALRSPFPPLQPTLSGDRVCMSVGRV